MRQNATNFLLKKVQFLVQLCSSPVHFYLMIAHVAREALKQEIYKPQIHSERKRWSLGMKLPAFWSKELHFRVNSAQHF